MDAVAETKISYPERVKGIHYEPNHIAPLIEAAFGIKFKEPPKKARVDARNTITSFIDVAKKAISKSSNPHPEAIHMMDMYFYSHSEHSGAMYYYDKNTYLYWSDQEV